MSVFLLASDLQSRVKERDRTEMAVFLHSTDKRLSGVGVIQYLLAGNIPAVLFDG